MTMDSRESIATQSFEDMKINEEKFKGFTRFQITVEPLFFAVMFCTTFTTGVTIDLFQRNACNTVLHSNDVLCQPYANSSEATQINQVSAQVNMAKSLVEQICPIVISLFAGPWSDTNGRKPFMILPFAGYFIYYLIISIMAFYPNMDPMYFVIPSIIVSLTGSMATLYLCSYCYLCDIFDTDKRSIRFSFNWSVCLVGSLVASSSVTSIYNASGQYRFQVVFSICAAICLLAFLYGTFLLKETILRKNKRYGRLIDLSYAKDVTMVMIIHPKKGHLKVLMNVLIMFSVGNVLIGESSIEYLIGQSQYSWTLGTFSLFSAVTLIISAISCALIPILLRKLFSLQDPTIVMCSAMIFTLAEVCKSLCVSQVMFWISAGFMRQYSIIAPIMNAMMSDLVIIEDMGKLYAFTGLFDSITGYISVPIYTVLYDYFLTSHHVLYTYFLSAVFGLIIFASALTIKIIEMQPRFESTKL